MHTKYIFLPSEGRNPCALASFASVKPFFFRSPFAPSSISRTLKAQFCEKRHNFTETVIVVLIPCTKQEMYQLDAAHS